MTLNYRFHLIKARLRKRWESFMGMNKSIDMSELQEFYRGIWSDASNRLSADFEEITSDIWKISRNGKSTLISNFKVQMDDQVVLKIAGNKELTYRMLKLSRLPVPDFQTFKCNDIRSAGEFMGQFPGEYFVVKPAIGTSGARGITTHVHSYGDLVPACALASLYGQILLIERYIVGESYRLLIMDGKFIHASRRRGLWVTGDGQSSIRRLLKNKETLRISTHLILADLTSQKVSMDTVLEAGREIYIGYLGCGAAVNSSKREIRTVFNEDATAVIGPELARQAIHAADVMNIRFAGVDIITLDPTVSLDESGGVINEINTTPGLHHHYNLVNQSKPPTAELVLGHLLGINNGS